MFRTLLTGLFIITLSIGAKAQTTFASLNEVWLYAESHNVAIGNAAYELQKIQDARKQSYTSLLPTVNATASYTENTAIQTTLIPAVIFGGPAGVYQPVQFGQRYTYAAGFSAQLDVVNLQSWFNVRLAREAETVNRAALGNARKTAYQQIANQYYSYLLSREAARLAAQSLQVADSVLASVSNKYSEGTVSLAARDIAELNLEKAKQTDITAQYQSQKAKNSLRALLNLSINDSLIITESPGKLVEAEPAGSNTPDPAEQLALAQTRFSQTQYRASRTTYYPTLSVIYSNTTQQFDNKFEPFDGKGPAWYPASYWTLRASWTIFNGGSRWLQVRKNKITYLENELQLDNARKQSEINDANLRLAYSKAKAMLTNSEHIMQLSFDNYTHISNRYHAGLASLEDRLNAFTDYINYQNQYLNSLSDMLVQLYQVKIRQQNF